MDYELIFSAAGILAMAGWLTLLASPLMPLWSDRIAGFILPSVLSAGYVLLIVVFPAPGDGGFESLDAVITLFSQPAAMLAGWVHFLAFDLVIGAWICRTARREGVRFWLVIPCLPLTFLFGPAGFLAFALLRLTGGERLVADKSS
ncbi:ABA4-like family protein [Pseudophaeobacter sp.]|uniref:ABA4-like family protein n=1 Tax=Pseudophaeobacter sp. TaxID=1971739 RepID=UPI0032968EDF